MQLSTTSGPHGLSSGVIAAVVVLAYAHREHRPVEIVASNLARGRDKDRTGLEASPKTAKGQLMATTAFVGIDMGVQAFNNGEDVGNQLAEDGTGEVRAAGLRPRMRKGEMHRREPGGELNKVGERGTMVLVAADDGGGATMMH